VIKKTGHTPAHLRIPDQTPSGVGGQGLLKNGKHGTNLTNDLERAQDEVLIHPLNVQVDGADVSDLTS